MHDSAIMPQLTDSFNAHPGPTLRTEVKTEIGEGLGRPRDPAALSVSRTRGSRVARHLCARRGGTPARERNGPGVSNSPMAASRLSAAKLARPDSAWQSQRYRAGTTF